MFLTYVVHLPYVIANSSSGFGCVSILARRPFVILERTRMIQKPSCSRLEVSILDLVDSVRSPCPAELRSKKQNSRLKNLIHIGYTDWQMLRFAPAPMEAAQHSEDRNVLGLTKNRMYVAQQIICQTAALFLEPIQF